jgi:hypothetical protein
LLQDRSDLVRKFADEFRSCLPGLTIGLAAEIIADLGAVGVSVGDAFVALLRNSL